MRFTLALAFGLVPIGEHSRTLAADLFGVVLRPPVVNQPVRTINRYRPSGSERARGVVEDCQCAPGLYAVIHLTGDSLPPIAAPAENPTMSQEGKRFVPPVLAVPVGTTVDFPNLDPFFHNVFSYSKTKRFDLGRYPQGQSARVRFDRAGIVKVFCDIHASMRAYIHVLETPYVTVSDEGGRFRMRDVKPGDYEVHVWQEGQPPLLQRVHVRDDSVWVEIAP